MRREMPLVLRMTISPPPHPLPFWSHFFPITQRKNEFSVYLEKNCCNLTWKENWVSSRNPQRLQGNCA